MIGGRAVARWTVMPAAVVMVAMGCSPGAVSSPGSPSPSVTSPASPSPAPSVASPSPEASLAASPVVSVDVAAAREAFDYAPVVGAFDVVSSTAEGEATVRDATYQSVDGRRVSALLVAPAAAGRYPAVLFLHWYATNESDGNRTEFLDEATDLAARGVVSLLPEQVFPWHQPPSGAAEDRRGVIDQVVDLRVGLGLLLALPEVDPDHLAVAGHDIGGMNAALIAGLDSRVDAAIVMAGVPHWADWYLRYWRPVPRADEPAYEATMLEVDPVTFLPDADIPLLLQFAESDQFVNQAAIDAWTAAAPADATTVRTYDSNHSLRTESARADRDEFLAAELGLPE